jgi:autotransporter-associated beta strand protein
MKTTRLLNAITLVSLLAGAGLARAGSHTWSGAVNNAWSNAGNWSAGGAPQFGEANISLIFPAVATRYASTNGVGNYAIDSIVIEGNNYSIGGYGITLTGAGYLNLTCNGTNNLIACDLTLNSLLEYFQVDSYDSLTLGGALTGPGGFYKFGRGTLTLTGSGMNTYAGPTTVKLGFLRLAKPAFTTAIPQNLIIGDPVSNSYFVEVANESDHQIADTADVTVNPNGDLYLKGHMEVINSLHLAEGMVYSDIISPPTAGQLTIWGGVTVSNSYPQASSIAGHLSLSGAVRTFDVSDLSILDISAVIVDGGQTAGIKKTGTGTMVLRSANTYSGDTTVQNGTLRVIHPSGLGATSGGTYVQPGGTLSLGQITVNNEHLYLNGSGYQPLFQADTGALLADTTNANWAGPITLQGPSLICAATNVNLTVSGSVDGPGKLTKDGPGWLILGGLTPNSFSGGAQLVEGTLVLDKTDGVNAIACPITLGDFNVGNSMVFLRLAGSQQIADNVMLTIEPNGNFDLNHQFETIGGLTMRAGSVYSETGLLTLLGDVNVQYGDGWFSDISGNLSLGGAQRTFDVASNAFLSVTAVVSDGGNNAGLTKTGLGQLALEATNTYGGVTFVNAGLLTLSDGGTPGSTANGTSVASGASLYLINTSVGAEGLTISGPGAPNQNSALPQAALLASYTNSWAGPVVLAADTTVNFLALHTNQLILSGSVAGAGGLIVGGTAEVSGSDIKGTLTLAGSMPNLYSGSTTLKSGTLQLTKTNAVAIPGALVIGDGLGGTSADIVRLLRPDQIADTAPVTITASGLLIFDALNAQAETIGSLEGNGRINLTMAVLSVGANNTNTEFSGSIAGVNLGPALIKEGTGNLTLSGASTFTGKTLINNGHLYVNGSLVSGIKVNPNGHLHGQGNVGPISGLGGWTLPGDNLAAPTHGALTTSSMVLDSSSHFNIDLGGTAASGNYDRVKVSGQIDLGNATLHLTQSAMAQTNDEFMIVENTGALPTDGAFAGYNEGDLVSLNSSQVFKITYVGGDGNDVVLIQQRVPKGPTLGPISQNGGQIEVTGNGIPKWVYTVEATEDLGNANSWQSIGTATADVNGVLAFTDPDSPNHAMRFYRFKAP